MTDSTDGTARKHSGLVPFVPGQSGNPAGRPKGARNKLGEAFLQALHDDFNEHGIAAVQTVRSEKPDQYLKVIASLLPKEHVLSLGDQYGEMTDDELIKRIRSLSATIAPFLIDGTGNAEAGVVSKAVADEPSIIH